ncbi:MAG: hypothetical protein ABL958_03765 [Bdellovibrionia bacterium]
MTKSILIVCCLMTVSLNAVAQIRDVDPTISDRILLEHSDDGHNIYRWCTLAPLPAADKKETPFVGEKIAYRGRDFICPSRLGCRPEGTYLDAELTEYQAWLRIRRGVVIAVDAGVILALTVPTYLATKGKPTPGIGVNFGKGLGILTSVNVAGWTLSPYLARITARMDWTRHTKAIDAISLVWDVNPPSRTMQTERIGSIKEVREVMNKTLCELDDFQQWKYR